MPDRSSKRKKPADLNRLAAAITREATDDVAPDVEDPIRQAAAALGRQGGLKGGPARAKKLTKKRRSEIAKKAARARWASPR